MEEIIIFVDCYLYSAV